MVHCRERLGRETYKSHFELNMVALLTYFKNAGPKQLGFAWDDSQKL